MSWIRHLFGSNGRPAPASPEAFARREAELKERHERLVRLAVEADVIQRAETPEEHRDE